MSLLNETLITRHLKANSFHQSFGLHIFPSIDSTNQYLKDLPKKHPIEVCCAEMQTKGRGRFQRQWFSPHAENLYCSIRWYLKRNIADLAALSLLVGIALMKTLEHEKIAAGISIKWPNDLIWQHKKLCGILIETSQVANGDIAVVVGIGLNVNMDSQEPLWHVSMDKDKPWCSLYDIVGRDIDRNLLLAQLIIQLDNHIQQFMTQGFEPFMNQWQQWDYLQNKTIVITQGYSKFQGTAKGITQEGQLIVIDNNTQKFQYFSSGEASISRDTSSWA